ncbi:MAG: HEAT repeat domain-containing protein [Pirellulaceae bacterium]
MEVRRTHIAIVVAMVPLLVVVMGCISGISGRFGTSNADQLNALRWKEAYGPTSSERIQQMRSLAAAAASAPDDQQLAAVARLEQQLSKETDVLVRREVVRTLGAFNVPSAEEALKIAGEDDDPVVRVEACRSWGQRKSEAAVQELSRFLVHSEDVDVRLAAVEALGQIPSSPSTSVLLPIVNDRDPAVQLAAMASLRKVTGQSIGDDVTKWRQYAAQYTAQDGATLAESR